jgi:hypothetical protein
LIVFFDGFNTSTIRATGDCPEEVVPIDNTESTGADGNFYNITGDNFLQTDPSAYEYSPTVILGDSYEVFLNSINTISLGNTSFRAIVRDAVVPISFTSEPLILYNLPGLIGPQYAPRVVGMMITTYGGAGSAGCSWTKIRYYSDGSTTTGGGIMDCPGTINPHQLSPEINSKTEDCTGGGGEIGVNLINSAIDEIAECISLTPSQTNSLYGSLFAIKLKNYLIDENNCSPEAKDFGILAVEARVAGGDVDFVEQVILDKSFIDNDCLYGVYTEMGKATKFKEYLQNFEPNGSIADLRFTTDDNFAINEENYTNAMAITKPPLTSNEIKIKFNTDPNTAGYILNKPDVFKAVAMIHEILHAEMYRKMLNAVRAAEISGNNLNWTNWTSEQFYNDFLNSLENKYFGIFDYFTRYNYGIPFGNNPNDYQHQQMAQHYRDVVKQALTDYDLTLTENQKEAISWIGLDTADIVAWQNLTPSERTAINNLQSQIQNTFSNGCN